MRIYEACVDDDTAFNAALSSLGFADGNELFAAIEAIKPDDNGDGDDEGNVVTTDMEDDDTDDNDTDDDTDDNDTDDNNDADDNGDDRELREMVNRCREDAEDLSETNATLRSGHEDDGEADGEEDSYTS